MRLEAGMRGGGPPVVWCRVWCRGAATVSNTEPETPLVTGTASRVGLLVSCFDMAGGGSLAF